MEHDLWKAILVSWLIALLAYYLKVTANRIGNNYFSLFQLKTLQEVIGLTIFAVFAVYFMYESIKWNYTVTFVFLVLEVFFVFRKW